MYQPKARHILSPLVPDPAGVADDQAWPVFIAIGKYWRLSDDPIPYRQRFRAFLANRICLNPLYAQFYEMAGALMDRLTADLGEEAALQQLFNNKNHHVPLVLTGP